MATAEFAVAIPALVLVVALLASAVSLGMDQLRCVDASRAAVRLLARGEPSAVVQAAARAQAPEGAGVRLTSEEAVVTVEVVGRTPGLLHRFGVSVQPRGVAHARSEASLAEDPVVGAPP
jgi:hypothetical protein